MSEQKITTDQIREAIYGHLPPTVRAEEEPKFDRWLATVEADAFDEGADAALENQETYFHREAEAGWDGFGVSHAIGIDRATKSTPNPHRGVDDE
jgi:hypothetical protein